jgi:hypothetical protein
MFDLVLQDPTREGLPCLIDAIGDAASDATFGRGLFSFATVAGVDLLMQKPSIEALVRRGSFELILGIDAITNRETLERVQELALTRPGLKPHVFWHTTNGIFHPKFCYFHAGRTVRFVVGSGNLTPRGLRDNFEVVSIAELVRSEAAVALQSIDAFLSTHRGNIRLIDNDALTRAQRNRPTRPVGEIEPATTQWRTRVSSSQDLLLAELPRGGDRWQQANFDRETARTFFGVDPDAAGPMRELFLNEINSVGAPQSEELRRFTFTRSRNLRLQLGARAGLPYPGQARPIAVFRRVTRRHFVYQLLLPGDREFSRIRRQLPRATPSDVRRRLISSSELARWWPQSPFLALRAPQREVS